MRIYRSKRFLQAYLQRLPLENKVGFVPTMGALHDGHLSLVKNAKNTCNTVVASIFVNPTQFDRKEDLDQYPSTLEADLKALQKAGCDVVFIPTVKEMYQNQIVSEDFDFDGLDKVMEGAHRKGHFAGVGTIVKRLFDIVKPHEAFFGEKDFQQLKIIQKMVEKKQIPVKIVGNPIYREADGLAMSSRNVRLTPAHRKVAPLIYQTLQKAQKLFKLHAVKEVENFVIQTFKEQNLLELEYFSIADETTLLPTDKKEKHKKYRGFIAVFAGPVRLIDNIELDY
jgi:pantoate--beta-alanine ligase